MARRCRSLAVRLMWRSTERLILLVAVINTLSIVSASRPCSSFSADQILDRVDAHFSECFPSPSYVVPLDVFKDAMAAHVYQDAEPKPLSLVVFARSRETLTRFASTVSSAVAGQDRATAIDFETLLAAPQSTNHALQSHIQSTMANALRRCPTQRSLFIIQGLDSVKRDRLPLLDTFLDPLNGDRALLHDAITAKELDCRRAMFVFLYHVQDDLPGANWRDFLVTKWAHEQQVTATTMVKEAFTPQALAGRFTAAVQLPEDDADAAPASEWPVSCRSVAQTDTTDAGMEKLGTALTDTSHGVFLVLLIFLGIYVVYIFSTFKPKSNHRPQQKPKLALRLERTTETTVQVQVTTPATPEAIQLVRSHEEVKEEKQTLVEKASSKKKSEPQAEAVSPVSSASTPRKQPRKPKKTDEKVKPRQGTRRSQRSKNV